MDRSTRYVMLITSLPWHGPLFGAKQTPLSRRRLMHRLKNLEERDTQNLLDLVSVLDWMHHSMEQNDTVLIERAERLEAQWGEGFLTDMLRYRMDMRTIVAALRRRRRGESAPPGDERWGYGRWQWLIERHWNEPGFRLQRIFPWVSDAERLIAANDSLAFERLMLGTLWEHLGRISEGHEFDFEAVVIYVLRWDLIARWSSYDGTLAAQRFGALVEDGLEQYATLFDSAAIHQPRHAQGE